jgi:hypothetical protein
MFQPGLKPGEIRTEKLGVNAEYTVTVSAVAGGSFTQVKVTDAQGRTVQSKVHQFEDTALRQYEGLIAAPAAEDEA